MADPCNFEATTRIFEEFCTVKQDKSYRKSLLLAFQKKVEMITEITD